MDSSSSLNALLDECIRLELLVSELYHYYSRIFEENRDFWWRLTIEEKNHASILKSGRLFLTMNKLPKEAVCGNMQLIKETCQKVECRLEGCKTGPLAREDAYGFAMQIESSAAELHFQDMLVNQTNSRVIKIFQGLGGDDKDHAQRIADMLGGNGPH